MFITPPSDGVALNPPVTHPHQDASCAWLQPHEISEESGDIPVVQSLQPVLQWDRFPGPGEEVVYDLMIWRGKTGWREVRLKSVTYERQGLSESSHRIETPLESATHYLWSVRARFHLNDQAQVTNWSHEVASGALGQPRYCHFFTSSSQDLLKAPDLPVAPSQWFPWGNWPLSPPDSERQEQSRK